MVLTVEGRYLFGGESARFGVCLNIFGIDRGLDEWDPIKRTGDQSWDVGEFYTAFQECIDSNFIGGVDDACGIASLFECVPSVAETWEAVDVGLLEGQCRKVGQR